MRKKLLKMPKHLNLLTVNRASIFVIILKQLHNLDRLIITFLPLCFNLILNFTQDKITKVLTCIVRLRCHEKNRFGYLKVSGGQIEKF